MLFLRALSLHWKDFSDSPVKPDDLLVASMAADPFTTYFSKHV